MSKNDGLPAFLAGLGIGAVVGLLLVPATRSQLGTRVRKSIRGVGDDLADRTRGATERVSAALSDAGEMWKEGEKAMSNIKDKLKDTIDDAADATKKVVDKAVNKSKDAAHEAGKHLEQGGKSLQDT
jgi:gas vesicle protein